MKIGLFFGSFNPIHIGHVIIANCMLAYSDLDEIWMVVTPHNPHKNKSSLLNDYHRLEMVHLALKEYKSIKASDIEFSLPKPSYTINTLSYLKEKYPKEEFCLIMGMDNLENLHKWKNYEQILENHFIYVYPRVGSNEIKLKNHTKIKSIEEVPIIQLSSTFIRKLMTNKKDFRSFLPEAVYQYIEKGNYYR